MLEEKEWMEDANAQRERAQQKMMLKNENEKKAFNLSSSIALLGIIAFYFLYQRYGRAHKVPFQGNISSEIPENLSPAVTNYILSSGQVIRE